jgi:hypothetical protein
MNNELEIEGISLTEEGREALNTVKGIFPESCADELYSILVGLVKADPTLDYIRIEKGGPSALVRCYCKRCEKDHYMTLGWLGHVQWIKTGLCPLCVRMVEAGK